jgi:hypothetical protein
MTRAGTHFAALTLFALLTGWWLAPVLARSALVVPADAPGDAISFVWNAWWMRHALSSGQSLLWTSWLFAPWGVDLTLHTHALLPSVLAAVLSRGGSIVSATNFVVALHLFLNFAVMYALLLQMRQPAAAALIGALAFGWSPFITAHLPGHFNLIAAWVLPLAALLLFAALEGRGRIARILFGLALAGTAYIDYYMAIYAGLLVVLLVAGRSFGARLVASQRPRWQWVVLSLLAALFLAALVVAITVVATGGGVISVAGLRVSMLSARNPIAAAGLLALIASALLVLPRVRPSLDQALLAADLRRLGLTFAIAGVALMPLVLAAIRLWQRGDYVSQRYLWRSAPAGIDIGTFFLGNPNGLAWGTLPDRAYAHFTINPVEQVAWLGPGVLALCACAVWLRNDNHLRRWLAIGVIFLVWALGPYLVALGHNLPILLPATLVRYVPIVANARIPSRAIVVVYLAASVLCAIGVTALLARGRRTLAIALSALMIVDYVPAHPPVYPLEGRPIDDVLRREPGGGAICELPLGLRDGFGERGLLDPRVLFYQTLHGRPMTGGFVARLSPAISEGYSRDPVLGTLLRLSEGKPLAGERLPSRADAGTMLAAHGIRFVVVNLQLSPADLVAYVGSGLPLRLIDENESHRLYALVPGDRAP